MIDITKILKSIYQLYIYKWHCKWKSFSQIQFFATPWTIEWNSPGQNTGMGSLSLLQGIFPTQGSTQVSHITGRFFTSWATREAQEYWSGHHIPSPTVLPNSVIELGSPALQVDSLLTELSGKPTNDIMKSNKNIVRALKFCFLSFTNDERWGKV